MKEIIKKELLEMVKLDSERYYNLAKEFHTNWIKEKRCECVNHPLIKSGKCVMSCKHYKKALKIYTKELCKTWNTKKNLLLAMNFEELKQSTSKENKK